MPCNSVVFLNARLTDDASKGLYNVCIAGSHVTAIDSVETSSAKPDADLEIDLNGAFIAPSMIDHHVHFSVWAKARKRASMAGVNTLQDALHVLDKAVETYDRKQSALVAAGLHLGQWTSEDIALMRKYTLDARYPKDVPIMVIMNDLHSAWCNTAMLQFLQLDPASQAFDGLLVEHDCFNSMVRLDAMQAGQIWDDLHDASVDAAKKGVTEIIDLDIDDNITNWPDRVEKGLRSLRVQCGIYPQYLRKAIETGLRSGQLLPGADDLLTMGPYKVISDGSLGTRTACCHTAYPSPPAPPGDYGLINYSEEEFSKMFQDATKAGLRLAVHAIGDKTHTVVLDRMERMEQKPLPGSSIEHAQCLQWDDLKRFSALGLAASIQPQHLNDDRELAERFWPTFTDRAFPYRALVDAGNEVRLGSDAPVAPLDPWLAIAAGVSRCRPGETDGWHPEQKISARIAYQGSTTGRRLQVKVGDIADLCVLEMDPLDATVDELRGMKVKATLLGGRFTWDGLRT